MNTKSSKLIAMGSVVFYLSACSGGGEETPKTTSPAPGAMSIDITGLPIDAAAQVKVSGPQGYSQTLSETTNLSNLVAGSYTIEVNPVNVQDLTFDVLPATQSVTVSQKSTTNVSLTYMTEVANSGVISNFGSVYINGVRYSTDDVSVQTDDDDFATEDDLDVGMQITLKGRSTFDGSINEALEIEYRVNAKGPISNISLAEQTLSVLGQSFSVDDNTVLINTDFASLQTGDLVEVSALQINEQQWLATRIEKEDSISTYRLKGLVSNLDTANLIFNIANTSVNYANAEVEGALVDGAQVRIATRQDIVDGVLEADKVEVKNSSNDSDSGKVSVDGVIQSVSVNQFMLSNQTIQWSDSTEFKGGDADQLAPQLRVKVRGVMVDEVLMADRVRIDKPGIIKLEGAIESIDTDSQTIIVLGSTLIIDEFTQLKDDSEADVRRFSLDLLSVGDWVEVKAFAGDNGLVVKKLEREDLQGEDSADDAEVKVEGLVSGINNPLIELAGTTIETSELTKFEIDEFEVSAEDFFAKLLTGDRIEAKGVTLENGNIMAIKVELDDNEGRGFGVEFSGVVTEIESLESFEVNGRAILVDEFTLFTNGSAEQLALNSIVEIHGREANDGSILATRIHFEDEGEFEIEGTISVTAQNGQFSIGNRNITFNETTVFLRGDAADLIAGARVEVKGNLQANGTLIATRIQFENELENESEISGEISALLEDGFVVEGVRVILSDTAEFKFGNSTRLAVGVWVKVEGVYDAEQNLVAREVKFAETTRVEREGNISAINGENEFAIGEQVIQFDRFTEFEDGTAMDLALGVFVKVKGIINDQNVLEAQEVEFDD